ncbi:MAG: hypothetical protein WBB67_08100 [bacterium]
MDFTVIRLTADGNINGQYRYNGPGNDDDIACSIAYGADGNVYAAGSSIGNNTFKDIVVISLPPDLGIMEESNLELENHYCTTIINGPMHLFAGKSTRVFDIAGRQIHTPDPAPGIYFIELDGQIQQKVIKIK